MPARPHDPRPAQPSRHPHAVYTESPLRTVQLQSDVRTPGRRALRLAASEDTSRHNLSSILQSTIYDALGSSEPVDLLPYVSKRAALRNRDRSNTPLVEDLKASTIEDLAAEADSTDSAQPPVREELRVHRPPHNGASVLDEALYATPPGCAEAPPSGTYGNTPFMR